MLCLYFRGLPFDKSVIHTVESIVIEWSHQIRDVLKKNSAQPLLDGKNPGPMVEMDFWKARCADLESVFDQVCCAFCCSYMLLTLWIFVNLPQLVWGYFGGLFGSPSGYLLPFDMYCMFRFFEEWSVTEAHTKVQIGIQKNGGGQITCIA